DILEDYRTVDINTSNLVQNKNILEINVENIWGDSATIKEEFLSYENGAAASFFDKKDLINGEDLEEIHFEQPNIDLYNIDHMEYEFADQTPLLGINDFSVSLKMRTFGTDQTILKQEDEYALSIDEQGYL